ncbi:MAG TPA: copper homeostasis protein CutC [Gemmatimonadaceae bacterium]|nr:copper homeostasis protein CutC [Gemmatimonadaceae bacterium]
MPSLKQVLVEAAVENSDAAVAAERAGARRIELCARLDLGGTTPNLALIEKALDQARIPVLVMVRPRGGDFVYTDDELTSMSKDIARICRLQPAGIVTGAIGADGRIRRSDLARLLDAAGDLPVTFHRAFDALVDQTAAVEELIDIGVSRILTAGGAESALAGVERIGALVKRARERITIIAGGGVRAHNVVDVIRRTGVGEVHARFVDDEQMLTLVAAATRYREIDDERAECDGGPETNSHQ